MVFRHTEQATNNKSDESNEQDAVFNYARCAWSLSLTALNFNEPEEKLMVNV